MSVSNITSILLVAEIIEYVQFLRNPVFISFLTHLTAFFFFIQFYRVVPPPMEWAQRADVLFVTVAAECKDVDFK